MLFRTFLRRRRSLRVSSLLDKACTSSRVAIKRRVLTRRSWIAFSDALARAFFQAPENCSQDLSRTGKSSLVVRFTRREIIPKNHYIVINLSYLMDRRSESGVSSGVP